MADGRLTRTTVQALASVDKLGASPSVDQAVVGPISTDSQLAGVPPAPDAQMAEIVVKRKRGRPPRNPGAPPSNDIKRSKKEDEDVCFICFDGGSLVLCDRRDCPKAYHPACVKRDESFFRRNIRWNCGWHLCNTCQRNALFMCYTCPYSLCKGCVKQADILCVRGNKGFCRTCMTTIMLIENIPQENKELVQVDFDDTSSWEYLFKVYWVLLKQKESFTLDELTRATNPWKVSGLDHKDHFPQKIQDTSVCKVSNLSSSDIHLETNGSKRRKTRKLPQLLNMTSQKVDTADVEKVSLGRADWASKELLEFVAHMKNGDTSVHSQSDVQALLLDYIRTNNLRDPRQKCQIICDRRLENLFGKSRVGHFEMLKLLEYHFKEESRTNGRIRGASIDALDGQVEAEGISGDIQTPNREKRRQTRIKGDEKGRHNNLDSYAAIDVHNINLIYLKQSLLKNLMLDAEKFHDKIVGSIVRIRISSNDQKQDMHRLVRIIGTIKASEPYKIGEKTENIMLRILNLNKIEDVMLDAISDQEFSEDECRRLRQSIKLGLVERMTVGEIQEKAMALQTMRVNDWLETEIMRLNHLRDRASEMGHRKELRECVEKIELLKTPEERQRRIYEIPEVHADPRMDPSYGSDDDSGESDIKKQDVSVTPKYSNSKSKAMDMISPVRVGDMSKDDKAKSLKTSSVNGERKRKISAKFHVGKMEGTTRHLRSSAKPEKRVDATSRVSEELSNQADSGIGSGDHVAPKIGSLSQAASDSSTTTPSSGMVHISDITELEKIWHYQDPSGKVQGPFCMLQLRKWNSSGFFPTDLRVWRINQIQNQSILLNDALRNHHHHCEAVLQHGICLPSHDGAKSDGSKGSSVEELNSNNGAPWIGCKPNEEGRKSKLTNRAATSDGTEQSVSDKKTQQVYSDQGASHMTPKTESSDQASPTPKSDNVMESQAVNNGPSSLGTGALDSATNCIMTSNGTETSDFPHSITKSKPENLKGPTVENKNPNTSDICKDLHARWETGSSADEVSDVPGPILNIVNKEVKDHDTDNKHSDASVEHDSGINSTVPDRADISVLPSAAAKVDNEVLKSHDSENRHATSNVLGILFSDMPDTDLKLENKGLRTSTAENKHCDAANVPGKDSGTTWSSISGGIAFTDLPTTSLKLEDDGGRSVENKHRVAQDSCISWSTASRLVGGEVHLTDVPSEWGAFPSLHAKPSVEDFNLVSGSSAKLAEVANDHNTPTSDSCQLTHCSPSHADCDPSAWQPIELSTLGDESVSDLLSEVEAMERRGMSYCGDDSIDSSRDDCFSPLEELSPNMNHVKSDGLNSTVDMHFQIQPNHANRQQHDVFPIDINDHPRTSCILSNPIPEVEEGVKPAIVSMPHHNVVSEAPPPKLLPPPPPPPPPSPPPPPPPPPPPSIMSVDCPSSPIEEGEVDPTYVSVHHPEVVPQKQPSPRTAGMKMPAADASWKQGPVQENAKFSGTGSILGNPNMHWSNSSQGMVTTATGANMHWTTSVASQGTRASQTSPRYSHSVGRHSGPKDRSHHHHGVDSGFGKSRTAWSRQSSFAGGGGSSRPPHRGQRVCKFYESGYCKKGASCKYLHP